MAVMQQSCHSQTGLSLLLDKQRFHQPGASPSTSLSIACLASKLFSCKSHFIHPEILTFAAYSDRFDTFF